MGRRLDKREWSGEKGKDVCGKEKDPVIAGV